MDKKTPLYQRHVDLGGTIVPFAGYLLPVRYPAGIIAEHMAVRNACGLFDVSHMGEIMLRGKDSILNLNRLMTNSFSVMKNGQVRYSPMCDENGGVIDDLIVYRYNEDQYMIVVNASNREKDFKWMCEHAFGDAKFEDESDSICQLALQGPKSRDIMKKLTADALPEKYYYFEPEVDIHSIPCIVSRTGYTNEFGYEIYADAEYALELWDAVMAAGEEFGLVACGLGARDTLRLEAGMPLYGHEMDETVTPLETGLEWAVKDDHGFIGLEAMMSKPAARARIGLKVVGKGIVREHEELYRDGKLIGHTTSGTFLPYMGGAYAMALVDLESAEAGGIFQANVRGRMIDCEKVELPFYARRK
ncbi:MAG: glycine cleavage system aminomethyltransferase GcvT [Clostridia bacterium]|nr:glycine cleavage system aminomethyltransferase GcvT [Clostridia bacterium]